MMGGLAYMTGLPDRPMRVGASVNDVMGGMFGVIAIQAALAERQKTGRGRHIQSALFENNVFLMGQAMMFETVTGTPAVPYSVKDSPWPVYDLFRHQGRHPAVRHHRRRGALARPSARRSAARNGWPIRGSRPTRAASTSARGSSRRSPRILREWPAAELAANAGAAGAAVRAGQRPGDLFDDPHLAASGGFLEIRLPDGRPVKTPALPVSIDGERLGNRPRSAAAR